MKAYLILEDGSVYEGESIGAVRDCICEVVFNTSVVGYVETLSDPSYCGQGVILTYPIVGNYGVNLSDMESNRIWTECLIVRELSDAASNFRMEMSLSDYLCRYGVAGIEGVDTRAITKKLRDRGTMAGFLTTSHFELEDVVKKLKEYNKADAVKAVTCVSTHRIEGGGKRVALIDCGMKNSLLEKLKARDMDITVYPASALAEDIVNGGYDGVIISSGPGDPNDVLGLADEVGKICNADIPVLGLELGHELVAMAMGGKAVKMTHGHRGGNYPVKFLDKNKVYITSQNHGYMVEDIDESIADIRCVNINDSTIEGIAYKDKKIVTYQFCPGGETEFVFDEFVNMMGGNKNA